MNLNHNHVYKKTEAGVNELQNSQDSLMSSWLRTILILIDGKKKYSEYYKVFSNHKSIIENGGVDAQFELLLELGLLEIDKSKSIFSDHSASKKGFVNPDEMSEKVSQAISVLSEIAEIDLAEDSWEIVLDIESCYSEADIKELIKKIVKDYKRRLSNASIKKIKKIYKQL